MSESVAAARLFAEHVHVAYACVSKYGNRPEKHTDDIVQSALLGLWRASLIWDRRGSFPSFAAQRVRWAIADGWRELDHMPSHVRRAGMSVHLVPLDEWTGDVAPDVADVVADRLLLESALREVGGWPALVCRRFYLEDVPVAAIAAEAKRSVSWVMYRKAEGLAALRAVFWRQETLAKNRT